MRANTWHGKKDVRVERVPDPQILNDQDAIYESRRQRFVVPTCTCITDSFHRWNRRYSRARIHG